MSLNYARFFIAILFFLSACVADKKEANDKLKQEVIGIHDEVMPKMDELKILKKEILQKSESLAADSVANALEIENLKSIAIELDAAFEGMFVWMRQFKSTYDEMSEEEIENYLLDQKVKVQEVNGNIKKSIASAKTVLGKS